MAQDLRIAGVTRPAPVSFTFDGRALAAPAGEMLAAALIANGLRRFGEGPDATRPRVALCLMGVCQQCLVRVDGRLAQACVTAVHAGMAVTAA